ncbi:hypothetical protein ABFS82_11G063700 [Erythranthe guttata]|uniref:D-cysteine desulfhydrase 2, mitochondrial n=1 Tax=Erythranthe guttata TaxID=4155 RepID=UPI00064DF041|nr:PREDICTED: D-cysteine desulfhydrase 2, mitochondrial [Erythranthe guttata]|eukprot:XP_012845578.1 PREDICTED: D-cysteine desulfhydrase 2, mitochondrial [Erythranthe guttata]
MRLQKLPQNSAVKICSISHQRFLNSSPVNNDFVSKLLDRRWALSSPDAKINQIKILNSNGGRLNLNGNISFRNFTQPCLNEVKKNQSFPSFYVVRDDLLHPLVNGNKARKLDALLPLLEDNAVTDVVTCGGCQSAHTAAVAVSCAERGLKSHLVLRGEEPDIPTGYNLVSKLYGNVVYVPRSIYAKREEMLATHAESVIGCDGSIIWLNDLMEASLKNHAQGQYRNFLKSDPLESPEKSRKVVIVNEGAGDAVALLGMIRLIKHLSESHLFGKNEALKIVVDAGTGTTAVGLALGVSSLGLPWEVNAVMLADKIDGYKKKEQNLISEFLNSTASAFGKAPIREKNDGIVQWVERRVPRKFGNILKGEVEECRRIAQQTGILVDPIYTLAAWNLAADLSENGEERTKVVMLHTGGTLGMFGLAQRYRSYFRNPEDGVEI